MRIRKKHIAIAVVILAVIVAVLLFSMMKKPSYPNIETNKSLQGNETAKILIEEFSDLQCPACASAQQVVERIAKEYSSSIKLEFYHYPLTMHPNAFSAAMAAECANDQGMFWDFVELAYKNQDRLDDKGLKELARIIGLDAASFSACLDSDAKEAAVFRDMEIGDMRNIQGTPSFFINGNKLSSWQYDQFKAAIEAELAD